MSNGAGVDILQDYADPRVEDITRAGGNRVAVIRTSDRTQFRSCRRRWGWQSHLKQGLGPKEHASPLWMGSGCHFAWEDFHGYRHYSSAVDAFAAYYIATKRNRRHTELPLDVDDLLELSCHMLNYYEKYWLKSRDPLTTYWHEGQPQVEVNAVVPIDMAHLPEYVREQYDQVIYSLTFDRVVIDEHDRLWIVEYKTAKHIETRHFATDPQVSAYCWAGNHLYDRPVAGVIYQQHLKDVPKGPKILANGTISTDMRQRTTSRLYRAELVKLYGQDTFKWPARNMDTLNHLAIGEDETKDIYVRRDKALRNEHACQAEGAKIIMELEEILNPRVALYPNPSRFHCYFCTFQNACINMDDGSDWEYELEQFFQLRPTVYDTWRTFLPPQAELDQLKGTSQLQLPQLV